MDQFKEDFKTCLKRRGKEVCRILKSSSVTPVLNEPPGPPTNADGGNNLQRFQ
jgi:hypothetical protein